MVHRMLMLENDRCTCMVDSALPIYGIFSALQSTTRTGALNVLYGLKSGGGESKGAVLKWGGESKGQF